MISLQEAGGGKGAVYTHIHVCIYSHTYEEEHFIYLTKRNLFSLKVRDAEYLHHRPKVLNQQIPHSCREDFPVTARSARSRRRTLKFNGRCSAPSLDNGGCASRVYFPEESIGWSRSSCSCWVREAHRIWFFGTWAKSLMAKRRSGGLSWILLVNSTSAR